MGKPARRGTSFNDKNAKNNYRDKQNQRDQEPSGYGEVIPIKSNTFIPRTKAQARLYATIQAKVGTLATGPAGTGKTHVAIAVGVALLLKDKDAKIVMLNPGIEIGPKLGIVPGDKDEKIALSVRPMRNILTKMLGASHVDNLVKRERVSFEPLGSILGMTFDNTVVILDEAQNSTPAQMKALLTRIGENSKVVLCGDFKEQKFIPGMSGLEDAYNRLAHLPSVGHIEFTLEDCVRSGFCRDVIEAYRVEE